MLINSFLRFAAVGAAGFAVDAGLLALLVHGAGMSPFWARGVSFPAAVLTTWLGHVFFTFGRMPDRPLRNLGGYALSSISGTLINLGVYSLCLMTVPPLQDRPVLALALGALAGLVFNYTMARAVLFKTPSVRE